MGDVRAQVDGAGAAAARFGRMRVRLAEAVDRAPNEVADATVPAFQAVAPVRTGALRANIHADGGEVVSTVASAEGFHYTGVTRFGRGEIVARGRALRFEVGGRVIFRKRVGPWKPAGDWAQRAHDEAGRLARDRFGRLIRDAVGS